MACDDDGVTGAGLARRNAACKLALLVLSTLVVAGCSGDGDDDGAVAASTTAVTTVVSSVAATPTSTVPTATTDLPTLPSVPFSSAAATTESTDPPVTPAPADTGVPGLDSDDAFCAAWSRFGGSWQVAAAASAFGDPGDAARLEVIAAPTVAAAYDALFAAWPDELAVEREVVADEYFGAFQRRSAAALDQLVEAGAGHEEQVMLVDVWVEALAGRDPGNPVLSVEVPAELAPLVDDAAAAFAAARVPLTADPSMVITAETPLTDDFLVTACPDQGSLVGGEVPG